MRERQIAAGEKPLCQWLWIPVAVFFLGLLSIGLLVWTSRLSERQRSNLMLVTALADLQIRVSTFHVGLEEYISGAASSDKEDILQDLDKAFLLLDAILRGGKDEHGSFMEPLRDKVFRGQAEHIGALLLKIKVAALPLLKEPAGNNSTADSQFDRTYRELLSRAASLEDILEAERARDQAKSRELFLGILSVWTLIVVLATTGLLNREFRRKKAQEALRSANETLQSQTEELMEHRDHLSHLVEERTSKISESNRLLRRVLGEREEAEEALRESEKQLRYLSSQILSAQETERRRISRELHDELGQALSVLKLRITGLKKGLRQDQAALREDLENILHYANDVIEDVRRLSRNLSPSTLEDLGLTSAVGRLIKTFAETHAIDLELNIADINNLFPQNYEIAIYRIFQEVLTNIGKHSMAKGISVSIKKDEDSVFFSAEDDGQGFDLAEVRMRDDVQRGLGLAIMEERLRIMGGFVEVGSEKGRGTRITFSIPLKERSSDERLPHYTGR